MRASHLCLPLLLALVSAGCGSEALGGLGRVFPEVFSAVTARSSQGSQATPRNSRSPNLLPDGTLPGSGPEGGSGTDTDGSSSPDPSASSDPSASPDPSASSDPSASPSPTPTPFNPADDTVDRVFSLAGANNDQVGDVVFGTNPDAARGTADDPTVPCFYGPQSLTGDGSALYIADRFNHTIRRLTLTAGSPPMGAALTTIAGSAAESSFADGSGATARFVEPYAIAYDPVHSCLIVSEFDTYSVPNKYRLRAVRTTAPYTVSTLIDSTDTIPDPASGGTVTASKITGVAVDQSSGTVFFASSETKAIYRMTHNGTMKLTLTAIAGSGSVADLSDGSSAPTAGLLDPELLYMEPATTTAARQRLFFCDSDDGRVRELFVTSGTLDTEAPATMQVRTLAGVHGDRQYVDGPVASARFFRPFGLAYDSTDDVLYVSEAQDGVIRRILRPGQADATVDLMTGNRENAGSFDGTLSGASWYRPNGMFLIPGTRHLVVGDLKACNLRLIELP